MTSKGEFFRSGRRLRSVFTNYRLQGDRVVGISRKLIKTRHPRALRGDPTRETGLILKFLEISEIRDFEDDGVW